MAVPIHGEITRRIPYLVKRGNIWWWLRCLPSFTLLKANDVNDLVSISGSADDPRRPGRLLISLRTSCPKEADRRAARLNLLFEEKRRSIETAMSMDHGMSDENYLERAVADMAATALKLLCEGGGTMAKNLQLQSIYGVSKEQVEMSSSGGVSSMLGTTSSIAECKSLSTKMRNDIYSSCFLICCATHWTSTQSVRPCHLGQIWT